MEPRKNVLPFITNVGRTSGACGASMIIVGSRPGRYVCGTFHAGGDHACDNRLGVARELAEDLLLEPLKKEFLSPAAIKLAVQTIRRLAKQPPKTTAAATQFDSEIEELERMVQSGRLSPDIAAVAIQRAQQSRSAALRSKDKGRLVQIRLPS